MLKKMRALVTNYECNKCCKKHTFEKFFDDDHECLCDEDFAPRDAQQDDISLEVEEFKDPESAIKLRETNTKPSSRQESYFVQSAYVYNFNRGGEKQFQDQKGGAASDNVAGIGQKPKVIK